MFFCSAAFVVTCRRWLEGLLFERIDTKLRGFKMGQCTANHSNMFVRLALPAS